VIAVSPGNWSQLGELTLNSTISYLDIGQSVGISGDTIVVASEPGFMNTVNAYVFVKPPNGWGNLYSATATLAVPTASSISVAISGDSIVVGDGGAAYIFVKPAGGWTDMTPTATLTSTDGVTGDAFGSSVSISGNTVVVGANGASSGTGAAYVFVKPTGGWTDMTQTAKLTASDGQQYDFLGWATSISGNAIALGTYQGTRGGAGKAYVFVEPSTGWTDMTQTAELTVSDPREDFDMGSSVSIDGDTVVAGAPDYWPPYQAAGGAYLYVKPPGGWANATQTAKLIPIDGEPYDAFGASVLIRGKTVVVGATGRSRGLNFSEGGAYVFHEPPRGWEKMSSNVVLTGSDLRHDSGFGWSLDMDGNMMVVGSPIFQGVGRVLVFGRP